MFMIIMMIVITRGGVCRGGDVVIIVLFLFFVLVLEKRTREYKRKYILYIHGVVWVVLCGVVSTHESSHHPQCPIGACALRRNSSS